MEFHFMRPQWLLLIIPALLIAAALWYQRDRAGSWQSVIAPHLLQHLVGEQTTQRAFNALPFIVAAWILAAFTASGPSWEKLPQPVHQKQDALVVLLDLSYSMKSQDLAPSRKDRARQKLLDLMATRKEGQTGLIAYAGDAHIVTPLTDDTQTIANLLPALNPDMMPVPGSNPTSAVAQGLDLLRSAGVATGRLLLVTDELTDKDTREITRLLRRESTPLSIMSVGTATGAPIPLPRGGFLKDSNGDIVMPGVDPGPLRELASETGGRYMAMQIDDSDIEFLLAESPLLMDEETIALDRTADAWEDQGYLFLIPLLPLVLALFRRGWLLQIAPVLLLLSVAAPAPEADAQQTPQQTSQNAPPNVGASPEADVKPSTWDNLWQTPDQQGRAALEAGNAERAAKLFETPQWSGTAAYQHQDYETAVEAFTQDGSADGWYNRANSLARAGKLDEAIAAYKESLQLAPGKEDAEQNLALVEKLKEQQEEQQQDQEQDGDQQDEQDQQENEQENEQDSSSESQSDSESSDEQKEQNEQSESGDQQASNDTPPQESEEEREQQQQLAEEQAQEQNQEPVQMPPVNPEELERDQAMEQWLRRVPDDPSGLLREKFRYESQLRQQQGTTADNEKNW